jgi:hypothetical protein
VFKIREAKRTLSGLEKGLGKIRDKNFPFQATFLNFSVISLLPRGR